MSAAEASAVTVFASLDVCLSCYWVNFGRAPRCLHKVRMTQRPFAEAEHMFMFETSPKKWIKVLFLSWFIYSIFNVIVAVKLCKLVLHKKGENLSQFYWCWTLFCWDELSLHWQVANSCFWVTSFLLNIRRQTFSGAAVVGLSIMFEWELASSSWTRATHLKKVQWKEFKIMALSRWDVIAFVRVHVGPLDRRGPMTDRHLAWEPMTCWLPETNDPRFFVL